MNFRDKVETWLKDLQDSICISLEATDGKAHFTEDQWTRPGGGGGRTRVIEGGDIFEKAGVNFSAVHGPIPEFLLKEVGESFGKGEPAEQFFATGVSLVIHPVNPHVPIIHMNVRYFRINEQAEWFGGGIDLTPVYIVESDARYFHSRLKEVCDRHSGDYYPEFKKWADDYFFIRHRNETRGVGGVFFDRLSGAGKFTLENRFDFVKDIGELFAPLYSEIVNRNKSRTYTEENKDWQMIRRGRYAEFNLVYDRGTRFGLDTGGRAESILMSLPPMAAWRYDYRPLKDSEEEKTMGMLVKNIDWIK